MAEVDPETLLEWLQTGHGAERDMQLIALEQLCMLLLMSDNIDRCFESCPPRTFLPALCNIFMDENATDEVLEVTARAITYYLDVSAECTRRIVSVEGAVKALCNRLVLTDARSRISRDLIEQCIKVLEFVCTRESGAVFEAGGLKSVLTFMQEHGNQVHRDTLHSAMSVVTKLVGKMEPKDPNLDSCVSSLTTLLDDPDQYVSDGALKCFSSLADRFIRRGVDPAPLARNELMHELVDRLSEQLPVVAGSLEGRQAFHQRLSTTIGLLSTLCRGSEAFSRQLFRSSLPEALEKALQGDDRSILETMRLVDTLLTLMCDGRKALLNHKRSCLGSGKEGSGEKSHRQLIDCIRSKDTEALIDAIDNCKTEVNYTDDVGQTLLNWASAFGTPEMVELLCERGADVNKGSRSSSLHYAACFGRPQIIKVLLKYGGNPDMRDEDGKLAVDKARERGEEGHKQVVQLLQSPGEWMMMSHSPSSTSKTGPSCPGESSTDVVVDNDPEVIPVFVKKLLPAFIQVFQCTMQQSIRKWSLLLIKKMVVNCPPSCLEEIIKSYSSPSSSSLSTSQPTAASPAKSSSSSSLLPSSSINIAIQLPEILSVNLNNEDEEESQLTCLEMVGELMAKHSHIFSDQLVQLGVFQRIHTIASFDEDDNEDVIMVDQTSSEACSSTDLNTAEGSSPKETDTKNTTIINNLSNTLETNNKTEVKASRGKKKLLNLKSTSFSLKESADVLINKPYVWNEWCIVRGTDCMYIWSDSVAMELSNGSNGWFRYLMQDKLATMYSSGSPEGGSDSSETRAEFVEKLQKAKRQVRAGSPVRNIMAGSKSVVVVNWTFTCREEGLLHIHNSDGQQTTILKQGHKGFYFESNRGTTHCFTAQEPLSSVFAGGWSNCRKVVSKTEELKTKVRSLAKEIYRKYSKVVESVPRESMSLLSQLSSQLSSLFQQQAINAQWQEGVREQMGKLVGLLSDEHTLSTYQLHTSGLIPVLLLMFKGVDASDVKHVQERVAIFKEVFKQSSDGQVSPMVLLVRKLVGVLELVEKLPVHSYDNPSSPTGFQMLSKTLKLRLEKEAGCSDLLDKSGKNIQAEVLVTVASLEKFILNLVAKQWYDMERTSFKFIQCLNNGNRVTLTHHHDFDENGLIYWIGTNAGTNKHWSNPATAGLVVVTSSEGRGLPYGKLDDILSRNANALNCHTSDDKNAWFAIDLGVSIIPRGYTLRHARGYGRSALRSWQLQVSKDGLQWKTLYNHVEDTCLLEPGSTASWPLDVDEEEEEGEGWRHVKIQQMGKNSSGQTHYLSISGFEIYGTVTKAHHDLGRVLKESEANLRKQRRHLRTHVAKMMKQGTKVVRGIDWIWDDQDGNPPSEGVVMTEASGGWVDVEWSHGCMNSYRMGAEGKYDLALASESAPNNQQKVSASQASTETSPALTQQCKSLSTPSLNNSNNKHKNTLAPLDQVLSADNLGPLPTPIVTSAANALPDISNISAGSTEWLDEERSSKSEEKQPELTSLSAASCDKPSSSMQPSTSNLSSIHLFKPPTASHEQLNDKNNIKPSSSSGGAFTSNKLARRSCNQLLPRHLLQQQLGSFLRRSNKLSELRKNNNNNQQHSAHKDAQDMSVSVPNLPSSLSQAASLLETYTIALRHNLTGKEDAPSASTTNPSKQYNQPSSSQQDDSPLSTAQSFPNLSSAPPTTTTTSSSKQHASLGSVMCKQVSALTKALTMSLASSESENDFMEMCRATSLLVDLADEGQLLEEDDEADEDRQPSKQARRNEDDEEDDDDDDDDFDDDFGENVFWEQNNRSFSSRLQHLMGRRGLCDDDDTVLRRTFASMVPAFDPRPGKMNVNQTQDFVVPQSPVASTSQVIQETSDELIDHLHLSIKMVSQGCSEVTQNEIELSDPNKCLFEYVQKLHNQPQKNFFDYSYVITYDKVKKKDDHKLNEDTALTESCIQTPTAATMVTLANNSEDNNINDVLELLKQLYRISFTDDDPIESLLQEDFYSKKIINKLSQQLQDSMAVASGCLPLWCNRLTHHCPLVLPLDARLSFFNACAFGTSRSIIWLQNKRDAQLERSKSAVRRDELPEFRVGRLKHERVVVDREGDLLQCAMRVFHCHADRKAVLEIEYRGEEGTGLGPSLEFYALVATQLQKKCHNIWWCEDDDQAQEYVHCNGGLFPAPLPQDCEEMPKVEALFRFLGCFLAKCIQDNRLVDLPLSRSFIKLMCMGDHVSSTYPSNHPPLPLHPQSSDLPFSDNNQPETTSSTFMDTSNTLPTDVTNDSKWAKAHLQLNIPVTFTSSSDDDLTPTEACFDPHQHHHHHWFHAILDTNDLRSIHTHRATFLKQLRDMLEYNASKGDTTTPLLNDQTLQELGLTFVFDPPNKSFPYISHPLIPSGETQVLKASNAQEYINLVEDFCLNSGITKQLLAFKEGFDSVFPMSHLHIFNPNELRSIMCGDQTPSWTRDDVINHTEPKLGYSKDSETFHMFADVLEEMDGDQRKAFLRFTTGCSSLPPGGLSNLQPRLTVVRKVDCDDNAYPSVNTCLHYLKLPQYSSREVLKQRLLDATLQTGFYLN